MAMKGGFLRGVAVLGSGTVSAQLVLILAAPVLTRLYSPEAFGGLAVYAGLLALFAVIVNFRYELAIPLPDNDDDAHPLLVLSVLASCLVTALVALIVYAAGQTLVTVFQVPEIYPYLWLLPPGVLAVGIWQAFYYWSIRHKRFSSMAATRLAQALVTVATQVAAFRYAGGGLIGGQAAGQAVSAVLLGWRNALRWPAGEGYVARLRAAAIRYRDFPLYSTWGGFANTAGQQLPPLLFAALFGASAAGFYALAHRLIAAPVSVFGQAVSGVFLADAARQYRNGTLAETVCDLQRLLIRIITPAVVFLVVFGEDMFVWVFGADWALSGEVASWLALWMLVAFSTSPISTIFTIAERQGLGAVMQGWLLACRVAGLVIGGWNGDFMMAVSGFALANVLGYISYLVVAFSCIDANRARLLRSYIEPVLAISVTWGALQIVGEPFKYHVFAVLLVVSAGYYAWLLREVKNA